MRFKDAKLQEMEDAKAEEDRLSRTVVHRLSASQNGEPRSKVLRKGARRRPQSAMSSLESFYVPRAENRQALHVPKQTKSFDLAVQQGRLFDELDLGYKPRLARWREKQLEKSVAVRIELEHERTERIRKRRDPQRERFQSLAYGRFVSAVRREEPHALTQYREARRGSASDSLRYSGSRSRSQRSPANTSRSLSWMQQ